jgi:hypothetical protein
MTEYINPHAPSCPWYDITEKTGAPNIKWCEETLCQWISEPANTWSNLGYMIIACVILYLSIKNKHNKELKQFGPIIFFMGAMSYFYHQSNFYGSQVLDFVGMFFFVGWVIATNLIRLGFLARKNHHWFNLALGTFFTILMHVMYIYGIKFQGIVLICGFVILGTEIMARKLAKLHYKYFISAIITLIIAFGFSISDGQRIWCDPTAHGWFSQGHAVWHWVASLGMLFIYLHYSQDALDPKKNG